MNTSDTLVPERAYALYAASEMDALAAFTGALRDLLKQNPSQPTMEKCITEMWGNYLASRLTALDRIKTMIEAAIEVRNEPEEGNQA